MFPVHNYIFDEIHAVKHNNFNTDYMNLKMNCSSRKNGKWPKAYTFSKAVAEAIIQKFHGRLPVAIFRPSLGDRKIFLAISPQNFKAQNMYQLLQSKKIENSGVM
jgi:nucleoside-diphosphate-sugar epimerase